ncbi:LysR family transcriptional regulator [Denitrobaculum tricleocarpae]|uniref:LysR family transcriptional regulator n=1 Tax=Denitrobaculum tricleocarpae TaxID=2591009 RepID=A0A545TKY0_9PROT|nr:LysR substrate-binding domain-containing protein [Denitrobaculum tricleocarpae]TQV77821.1 LysR family transcriptional regulator [Denitrobaculum tricleocarpae]
MLQPPLEIDLLRSFVAVAEGESFTSAGAALGASQSAMSVRIRKLEERLGRRLLDRTPRSIALTPFGEGFLGDARRVLEAHDDAMLRARNHLDRPNLALAVSDHAAGGCLPQVLMTLAERHPEIQFLATVGASVGIYEAFTSGQYDAVVVREESGDNKGRRLFRDKMIWAAARTFEWDPNTPLPLISLAAPCGVRATAITALEAQDIAWREVFVGTGVAAVQAAVSAGLGIAALDSRNLPDDCRPVKKSLGLPLLPATQMLLHHRLSGRRGNEIASAIAAAFRETAGQ